MKFLTVLGAPLNKTAFCFFSILGHSLMNSEIIFPAGDVCEREVSLAALGSLRCTRTGSYSAKGRVSAFLAPSKRLL